MLRSAYSDQGWFTGVVQIIISGVAGPAFLRSQVAIPGPGGSVRELGLQRPYGNVRSALDAKIDCIGAVSESRWIQCTVLPTLNRLSLEYLAERSEYYVRSLDQLDQDKRDKSICLVRALAADADADDGARRHALLQYLLDNGGRSVVKSLCREATVPTQRRSGNVPLA